MRYFIITRTKNDKPYYLCENRRRGQGYIWRYGETGFNEACLFESRGRARSIVDTRYNKPSDGSPSILEVEESSSFVITAVTDKNVYWLQRIEGTGAVTYRWVGGDTGRGRAYRFITRAAAEQVNSRQRPVQAATGEVVELFDRVLVKR